MERHEAIVAVTDYGLFSVKEEVAKSRQLDAPQYTAPEVVYLFFGDCLFVHQLFSKPGYDENDTHGQIRRV